MSVTSRVEKWCETVWDSEQTKIRAENWREAEVRAATVHILKQALQVPPALGAIYGCLSTIRATLTVIAILLAAITFHLYVH